MFDYNSYWVYHSMKLKPDMVPRPLFSTATEYTYANWKSVFCTFSWQDWCEFSKKFGETIQFALLRGMTVIGVGCGEWNDVFGDVLNGKPPFQDITNLYLKGQLKADWRFFAQKIANESLKSLHHPAGCPFWLFPYGYDQRTYLQDLAVYWDNIHENYHRPWETVLMGEDSPEVARIKRLSWVARQEIDYVASQSQQNLKR
jgi:hypothetical protein